MKYCGIADAHGIESFLPERGARKGTLQLRAQFNRQRHACYYEAQLDADSIKDVKSKLKAKDWKGALEAIKSSSPAIGLVPGYENSWELIPNSKLDPWNPQGYDKKEVA